LLGLRRCTYQGLGFHFFVPGENTKFREILNRKIGLKSESCDEANDIKRLLIIYFISFMRQQFFSTHIEKLISLEAVRLTFMGKSM
jgi:hypothetical protein